MKTYLLVIIAALFSVASTFAQSTNAAPISPEDIAKLHGGIDSLLPLIPASYQPLAVHAIGLIAMLGVLGRVLIGWRNNGLFGVIAGLFGGVNTPKAVNDSIPPLGSPTPAKGATLLKMLLCLALPALLLAGCGTTPHQYVDNESGTGMKLKLPVGYSGNNIFEVDLTVGTFKHTSLIQPVLTNRVYTPSLAVAATTRGKLVANAMNTSTNATVSTQGGDSYVINTGHAESGITNSADVVTATWQDEATK